MAIDVPITQELLHQLIDYDPMSGSLTWRPRPVAWFSPGNIGSDAVARVWNHKNAGRPALNHVQSHGYLCGAIFGKGWKAHRAAWLWMTGELPDEIDHVDGVRTNNAFSNLRNVSKTGNQRNRSLNHNNSSGRVGVYYFARNDRWVALIAGTYIGCFETFDEAAQARAAAERGMGFHTNHGTKRVTAPAGNRG